MKEIFLGGGCFWCTEATFKEIKGVEEVISGYAGGTTRNPTYKEVCKGNTGHAEVIKVKYNPKTVKLEELLVKFFKIHNPTTKNREGPDKGSQYRSIILYKNERQKNVVEEFIQDKKGSYEEEIVTEVESLDSFYAAEEKHQDYFEKNPKDAYCRVNIPDKIEKVKE